MKDELEKMKLHSPDWVNENIRKLAEIFPNCVTETLDADGTIKRAIDYDQLRQELSDHIVDGPQERYHLTWPGKREALIAANAPIAKTLRPARDESVNFDTTQNLFIEGDNLDALKLLQETYLGKVKMIYIDPPYNTGNDFIYEDDFAESAAEFLERSNQKDEEGNRLIANPDSKGRFHSDWLSMMLPRLKLARNLLSEDGVTFISIDEGEVSSLEHVCKEVFGEENVLGHFPVVMNLKGNQDAFGFAETHEYFLACMKSREFCRLNPFSVPEEEIAHDWQTDEYGLFKEADNLRATGVNAPREKRPNLWYPIFVDPKTLFFYISSDDVPLSTAHETVWPINPDGNELSWYWGRSTFNENQHNLILKKTKNGWQFYKKQRPSLGELPTRKPKSFFYKAEYSTSTATTRLKNLMGSKLFDGPKPIAFLNDLIEIGSAEGDMILDFFAGSATTAHAAMEISSRTGKSRKFTMVQLPEECDPKSEAAKAGYSNIAEISKERIRRAGAKILEGECHQDWNKDIGFRVLKVDTSNMKDVYYRPDEVDQSDLLSSVDNIKPDRTGEDLLFQVLVDWGVDLTLPIRHEKVDGKSVYFVDDDALIASFETGINVEFVKQLATHKPLRVVFRDNGFASDDVKANVAQIFRQTSPDTDIKVI
jgi:adenine-specific DNA-methyltransferase